MTAPLDTASGWLATVLMAARPKAIAALLRYFRDLDTAEEAFQEACLRALDHWPARGPPRDPAAWLIMVGRNAALDAVRRDRRLAPLPPEEQLSDLSDTEAATIERLDAADYRDDILRLLFVCCSPELPTVQQIALALRVVSGLSVAQIARAFLVSDAAMEQRITRAKRRIAAAAAAFETPGPVERAQRVAPVAAMVYLLFNEGYSGGAAKDARASLCGEAIRLARLLLGLYPSEPELMGLLALLLLQQSRSQARQAADGTLVLLEEQDRSRWDGRLIVEGLALVDKAMRQRRPGPYQIQAAIAALHARAATAEQTDWAAIEQLYCALERFERSPVVALNRAVAIWKTRGATEALTVLEPLADALSSYFYFHGARGAMLQALARPDEARAAYGRAIALARTPAEADHIRQRLDRLQTGSAG